MAYNLKLTKEELGILANALDLAFEFFSGESGSKNIQFTRRLGRICDRVENLKSVK